MKQIAYFQFMLIFFTFFSCSGDTPEDNETQDHVETDTSETFVDTLDDYTHYSGYIDNDPISAYLIFNQETEKVNGTVSLLATDETFGIEGLILGKPTNKIYQINLQLGDDPYYGHWYIGSGSPESGLYGSHKIKSIGFSHDLALIPDSSELYLDPKSQLFFQNEAQADHFFKENAFVGRKMDGKQGLIVSDENTDLLPEGLDLYDYTDKGTYELIGKVGEQSAFIYNDGTVDLEPGVEGRYVDSVEYRLVYEYLFLGSHELEEKYVLIRGNKGAVCILIEDLWNKGYYLEGDAHVLMRQTRLGVNLIPLNSSNEGHNSKLYDAPSNSANVLSESLSSEEGHCLVKDCVLAEGQFWLKLEYEYYEIMPCTKELRSPRPALKGWMQMHVDKFETLNVLREVDGCD